MKADGSAAGVRRALPRQNAEMAPAGHRALIERLSKLTQHTIAFVEYGEGTCGTYALKLWTDPRYRAIAAQLDLFAGKDFFGWLIGRLDELQQPAPGCLAVYFNIERPEHVGIVLEEVGRVRSKWGAMPVYEHGILEVPDDYGDEVKFYRLPDHAGMIALFVDYARELVGGDAVCQALGSR